MMATAISLDKKRSIKMNNSYLYIKMVPTSVININLSLKKCDFIAITDKGHYDGRHK